MSDPTVVSLELLTVFGVGTMCFLVLKQLIDRNPARHYWIVVLSTAELYGGWMTFCPEWLTGSPSLDTSNPLYLWVYLFVSGTGRRMEDGKLTDACDVVHEYDVREMYNLLV